MHKLEEKIQYYNEKILKYQNKKIPYKVIKGNVNILLSAPHCIEHTRNGKELRAEGETGAIVQLIADEVKCWCILKTYNNQEDANYDLENNLYKEEIIKIIKENDIQILVDFHGADNSNQFDIEIGTDNGNNLCGKEEYLNSLIQTFKEKGINNIQVDTKFKASSIHTISKTIAETMQIPCIQLEIVGKYRYNKNEDGIQKLVQALEKWIREINVNQNAVRI